MRTTTSWTLLALAPAVLAQGLRQATGGVEPTAVVQQYPTPTPEVSSCTANLITTLCDYKEPGSAFAVASSGKAMCWEYCNEHQPCNFVIFVAGNPYTGTGTVGCTRTSSSTRVLAKRAATISQSTTSPSAPTRRPHQEPARQPRRPPRWRRYATTRPLTTTAGLPALPAQAQPIACRSVQSLIPAATRSSTPGTKISLLLPREPAGCTPMARMMPRRRALAAESPSNTSMRTLARSRFLHLRRQSLRLTRPQFRRRLLRALASMSSAPLKRLPLPPCSPMVLGL